MLSVIDSSQAFLDREKHFMVQYLWYLQMSFAPFPILAYHESPVLKYDFLFSVNVLDVHVKQRSVSESSALDFDYLKTILSLQLHRRKGLCSKRWSQEEMQQCITVMSDQTDCGRKFAWISFIPHLSEAAGLSLVQWFSSYHSSHDCQIVWYQRLYF